MGAGVADPIHENISVTHLRRALHGCGVIGELLQQPLPRIKLGFSRKLDAVLSLAELYLHQFEAANALLDLRRELLKLTRIRGLVTDGLELL